MNFIKFFLFLIIILFAFPAESEIYKYVDENGNVHFTDDFSSIPTDQRDDYLVSEEYEGETDEELVVEPSALDESGEDLMEESTEEGDNFSDETDRQEELQVSADTPDEAQNAEFDQNQGEEGEFSGSWTDTDAEKDLVEIRNQLEMMKKEIDKEYQALVKQKKELADEAKSLKGRDEILKHNKKVEFLNKKAEAYSKKGKIYEARVDAYNEQIMRENASAKKKAETP